MTFTKIWLICILCSLCILKVAAQNTTDLTKEVEEKLLEQEEIVNFIASATEKLYKNRQREISDCVCSTHACSTDLSKSDLKCYDKIRLGEDYCHDYKQEKIDSSKLKIRLPPNTNPANLSDRLKSSICTFRYTLFLLFNF